MIISAREFPDSLTSNSSYVSPCSRDITRLHVVIVCIVWFTEGKTAAEGQGAKYTEVSAILNHKVDDLLVGVLKQIRLQGNTSSASSKPRRGSKVENIDRQDSGNGACCISKSGGKKGISLKRMFFKSNVLQGLFKSKSCENLFSS